LTRASKRLGDGKSIRQSIINYFIGFNVLIVLVFIAFVIAFIFTRSVPVEKCGKKIIEIDETPTRVQHSSCLIPFFALIPFFL